MLQTEKLIDLLRVAAHYNRADPLRNSQMLCFPAHGDLLVAGDIHSHSRNFERIVKAANLAKNPQRHVLLQEIIHGGALGSSGEDTSLDLLVTALQFATKFPGQVHFILANHDMAQVQRLPIMKDGYDLTDRFNRNIELLYGKNSSNVNLALREFFYSQPLAAITNTGIFFSHSLPSPRDLPKFDPKLLSRQLTEKDYQRAGPVYQLIWGRNQTQAVLQTLSRLWWAELFVCGHQAQDNGFGTIGDRMLIIDSCHNHGVILPLDLARQYTLPDLTHSLIPLASLA